MQNLSCDFLVIGSGVSGLSFALKAAAHGRVILLSKTKLAEGNSLLAQGGIAAVTAKDDSMEDHCRDTIMAGAGLCDPKVVSQVISQGPDRVRDLINWGVKFDQQENNSFDLTKEGGHSKRRILHVEDQTGKEIHSSLLHRVKENKAITLLEDHLAIELITLKKLKIHFMDQDECIGAYILNKENGKVTSVTAKSTILATGGAGKVYLYTSNWSGSTGDGIAMAHRAGARVANLEFMQFHPTCLFHPSARNFLISEAVRGEGGELVDASGHAFMQSYHPLGSLAPRDIVARSIDAEMKKSGEDCVYLDITQRGREYLSKRFPHIYQRCLELDIDIAEQAIPVVPAAHYLCGGVVTDLNGRTDLKRLFALGETACSGLHGANRLASNSLLECLAYSHNASEYIKKHLPELSLPKESIPQWHLHSNQDDDELIVISHMWEEIRRLMWNYVGIVRSNRRLKRAHNRLQNILSEITEYYSHFKIHADIVELRNIAIVADLTVQCALSRKESRGIHFSLDYPNLHSEPEGAENSVLIPIKFPL